MMCADDLPLQKRPNAFDALRVNLALSIFAFGVIKRAMLRKSFDCAVGNASIGNDQLGIGRHDCIEKPLSVRPTNTSRNDSRHYRTVAFFRTDDRSHAYRAA